MEINDDQHDDLVLPANLDPAQPLRPQYISTRRQLPEELDCKLQYIPSEEPNDHPFAPQIQKPLLPKYLDPIRKPLKLSNPKHSLLPIPDLSFLQDPPQNASNITSRKSQDSYSTGDSGKSTLSEGSADCLFKDEKQSPRKKKGKAKVKQETRKEVAVCQNEVLLVRQYLIKQFSPKDDDTASVYSYLTSIKDYVPLEIVSLIPQRSEDDPFSTAFSETRLESLENIFTENSVCCKRIFIQGNTGCGKSTLLGKITRDWAKAQEKVEKQGNENLNSYELLLVRFSLLFPIPLDRVGDEKRLQEVLSKYVIGKDCPLNVTDVMKLIGEQQGSVMFLLDGYDEYSDVSVATDEVLSGTMFPDATIVLTSQSWKLLTSTVSDTYDRLLEVKGFSNDNGRKFISTLIKSKKLGTSNVERVETELLKNMETLKDTSDRNIPLLLLYRYIIWLEKSMVSVRPSDIHKDMVQCLYDIYKRENTDKSLKAKEVNVEPDTKFEPTLQALLVNIGKIAFRCLLSRKQCPKRVPSHWFDQTMYRDYLLLALELGLLQETKIVSTKQKEIVVATFVNKSAEEFLAAYYLCNLNDTSIVFHEQAAIIELINAGKIEKAFVYKFLDILIFAAGINPVIACELLNILIPEMESDCTVMEKLYKCAEEITMNDELRLSLKCLLFDQNISQTLIKMCQESLEYLSFVNCELQRSEQTKAHTENTAGEQKAEIGRIFFTPAENLKNLKFLKLDHVKFTEVTMTSVTLARLEELTLRAVSPAGKGVVEVLTNVKSPVLHEVTIDYCDFSDELVCLPRIDSLTNLSLGNIKFCSAGWGTLLQSTENLSNLRSLACSRLRIEGEGVVIPRLKSLTHLELNALEFGSESCCADFYASFNNLWRLEVLEVSCMSIPDLVPNLKGLPNLKRLTLNEIVFSSEIAFPKCTLSILELNHLRFIDHCGQSFISSMGNLSNLSSLKMRYCNFERENISFLKLKSVKTVLLMKNNMTSNCWCVSVFSLGQLENLNTLEVTYALDEETNVGALVEDMVDQRSPVPKIVSYTKSGTEKSIVVDFTNKESLMKTGSCCMQ